MDNSFLAFYKNSITQALQAGDEVWTNNNILPPAIRMMPNETFLQITNNPNDIAFTGNVMAELVNCQDRVMYTFAMNENFFLTEFSDNGKQQIAYEFGNVGEDFGTTLLILKLTHTVSGTRWYSNPFCVTEYEKHLTKRLEYKANSKFRGTAYDLANYYQTIRIKMKKSDIDNKRDVDNYTLDGGGEISLRPTDTGYNLYLCEYLDNFVYLRLLYLTAHPIIYVDGIRVRNCPEVSKGERFGNSNFFVVEMKSNPTEEERISVYQIFEALKVIGKVPEGDYTLPEYNAATATSSLYTLTFNKPITLAADISAKLYKDGVLFATFDNTKFSVAGNTVNVDVSASPVTDVADYSITIPADKVTTALETWAGYVFDQWKFKIQLGDYEIVSDYDEDDYL